MGWTYLRKDEDTTAAEFLRKEFTSTNCEVLDVAVKLRTAYAACRNTKTGEVFALVVLLDYRPKDYYNFGYKDMDETMGPYECDCPERILKLLTPTDHEYALGWRERCWARIKARAAKPKLTDGCKVRFAQPIEFTNGDKLDTFEVEKDGRYVRFWNGYTRYNITGWADREYEVVG